MGNADITLRHLSRRHAEALARPYVTEGPFEVAGWDDTQVTASERRLDKTLLLRFSGELNALEIEFEYRYARDLPDRIHEYQALSRLAFRAAHPERPPPRMETVVILLTGRRRRWLEDRTLRTGWRRRRWSRTHFRIDAVYQRTVAQLRARGSPFWLAFAPLAVDADVAAMRTVVDDIRAEVPAGDDRWELFAALLVMADVDPWGYSLSKEIEVMIQEEPTDLIQVSKTLRTAYERGQRDGRKEGMEEGLEKGLERGLEQGLEKGLEQGLEKGLEQGLEKGLEQGLEKGLEQGLEKGLEQGLEKGLKKGLEKGIEKMLRDLFAKRLHRALTAREQMVLDARAKNAPEEAQEKLFALEGEALAAWLSGPEAR